MIDWYISEPETISLCFFTAIGLFYALWYLIKTIVWKPKRKKQEMIDLIRRNEGIDIPVPPGSQLPNVEYLNNYLDPLRVKYYKEVFKSKYNSKRPVIAGLTLLTFIILFLLYYIVSLPTAFYTHR